MRLGAWWVQKQIDKALTGPASEDARHLYRAWVKRRLLQFDVIAETSLPAKFDVDAWEHRDAASFYEEAIDRRFGNAIARFRSDMSGRGHEEDRIDLSVRRILEPLVDARLAGGIERLMANYSKRGKFSRELEAFVKQGIRRERFILDRKPFDRCEVSAEMWDSFDAIDPDSSE